MSTIQPAVLSAAKPIRARRAIKGFTLIELLVATAIFLIVASAAFSLFSKHVSLAAHQRNLSTVNIGLRNAMTQLQIDLSGAGQNLLTSVSSAGQPFSLGVIVNNSVPGVAPVCKPTADWSYPVPSACFDSLTIVNPKASCPVLDIQDPGQGYNSLGSSSIMWGDDPNNPGNGATLTADASCFKNGDELLVIQLPTGGQQQVQCDNAAFNYCMAVVTLTKDAQVSGSKIQLQHNPTGASSDPLGITNSGNNFSNALGQACPGAQKDCFTNGAYIINLGDGSTDVTYAVQTSSSDDDDPQLLRCTGATCSAANEQLLSDQVIGFKVGAAVWDNAKANATDIANYYYDGSKYCSDAIVASAGPPPTYVDCTQTPPAAYDPYDFTLVRAIRISMVGRTRPGGDLALLNFTNGFDNGPYLVQQASVVIDLRNLSNPDSTN